MTVLAGSFLTPSVATRYLNAFDVEPLSGRMMVPRMTIYDDGPPAGVRIDRERFRDESRFSLLEEIGEVWEAAAARPARLGAWKAIAGDGHIRFEGPSGRMVQWDKDAERLIVRVGFGTPSEMYREEIQAAHELTIPLNDEDEAGSAYEFTFGPGTLDGLLSFLDIEGPVEHFEWYSRDCLERALHARLSDGIQHRDRFSSDHHGVRWRRSDKGMDRTFGMLWADDYFPTLHINSPSVHFPLLPGFQPLWDESVRRIKRIFHPLARRLAA